jgi:hypothetical protein
MRRPAFKDDSVDTKLERALKQRWRGINTSHVVTGPRQGAGESETKPCSESSGSRILDQEVASVLHYISRQPDPSQIRRRILAASLPVAASFTELFDSVPQERSLTEWEMPDLEDGFYDISIDELATMDTANNPLYSSACFRVAVNSPPITETPRADTIINTEHIHTASGRMNCSGGFDMEINNSLLTNRSLADLSRDLQIINTFRSTVNRPPSENARSNTLIRADSGGVDMAPSTDWSRADISRDLQIINMLSGSSPETQNYNSNHTREEVNKFVAATGKGTTAPGERRRNLKETPSGISVLDCLRSQILPVKSADADAEAGFDTLSSVGKCAFDEDQNNCACPEFFPVTLHRLLMDAENDDKNEDVIKFVMPFGRSFIVTNIQRFESEIMPFYFPRMKRFASFQRQLNLYNFSRVGGTGPSQTEYFHANFVRDNPGLVRQMRRTKIKGLFKVPLEKRRYRQQHPPPHGHRS